VAIELELSDKGVARLQDIMYGYAHDPKVDAVLYLVESDAVARRVARAARNAGIESQVHVQRLASDAVDGAPAPATGREPARSAVASAGRAVASRQAPEAER
jgi:hypothetical protein